MFSSSWRARALLALTGSGALALPIAAALVGAAPAQAAPQPHAPSCHDADGDGYGDGCVAGLDCNDGDAAVHPGSAEACNFRDDDCSGKVDDDVACTPPPVDPKILEVPAASFRMGSLEGVGSADEWPAHPVQLSAFRLDRYEVTNGRFAACVNAGRCTAPALASSRTRDTYFGNAEFDDYPVVHVSWSQAEAFCTFAGGRLPTEAEWERAAKGTSERTYPWGEAVADCSRANFGGLTGCAGDTDRVGRRTEGRSPVGADDMAGNVWEWTADRYDAHYYERSVGKDPAGPATGSLRVARGGCFMASAASLRTSCRKAELPDTWAANVGFRCAYAGAK